MRQKILIVDGHSMIFASPELEEMHRRNTAIARETLVRKLTGLQDASDWTVAVVFDGKGAKASSDGLPNGIPVFYSKSGQSADSLIERLAAKYAAEHAVFVATNDNMERTTVEAFGCESLSAEQLFSEMDRRKETLQEKIKKL